RFARVNDGGAGAGLSEPRLRGFVAQAISGAFHPAVTFVVHAPELWRAARCRLAGKDAGHGLRSQSAISAIGRSRGRRLLEYRQARAADFSGARFDARRVERRAVALSQKPASSRGPAI